MNKSFIILIISTTLFAVTANSQTNLYSKYMYLGKSSYYEQKYRIALERFKLAKEFAKGDDQKVAEKWKDKTWKTIDSIIQSNSTTEHNKKSITKLEMNSLIREGNLCFKIAEFDCAAINYSKVLEIDNNNIEILVKLKQCYAYLKNYKKNYYIYLKLMQLDSSDYKHYYNFSFYALFNEDYDGARKAAKISLFMKPDRKMVNSNLAISYILNNQYNKAEKIYKEYRNKALSPYMNRAKVNFLEDIRTLEKAGVHHKDFKKAKKLLE